MPSLLDTIQNLFDGTIFSVSRRFWGVKALEPEIKDVMTIDRQWFTDKTTIGTLMFDGIHMCFTLEDTCRRKKVAGITAIPSGRYEVVMDYSKHFDRIMPHILDVPFFEGVRMHKGSYAVNTDGCVLVGLRHEKDAIFDCQKAIDAVEAELKKRLAKGKVFVSVFGGISKEQFSA